MKIIRTLRTNFESHWGYRVEQVVAIPDSIFSLKCTGSVTLSVKKINERRTFLLQQIRMLPPPQKLKSFGSFKQAFAIASLCPRSYYFHCHYEWEKIFLSLNLIEYQYDQRPSSNNPHIQTNTIKTGVFVILRLSNIGVLF